VGRADLPAKALLVEFPFYLAALWFLIPSLGILGAALVWAGRFTLEALALFLICVRLGLASPRGMVAAGVLRGAAALALFGGAVGAGVQWLEPLSWRVTVTAALLAALAALAWVWVADPWERQILAAWRQATAGLLGRGTR
jgi:hypothetical protein